LASAAKNEPQGPSDRLFRAIGDFLSHHRLSVDPAHYAFAHRVLSHAEGPLAAQVGRLTEGGVRLTSRDIEELGGSVAGVTSGSKSPAPAPAAVS